MDYKFQLKGGNPDTEHWIVNEDGRIADPLKKLTKVFEGTTVEFLEAMSTAVEGEIENTYLKSWKEKYDSIVIPEFEYSRPHLKIK